MWEFMAKDIYDASVTVMNWINCGIMPDDRSYTITENPERAGYYIARENR